MGFEKKDLKINQSRWQAKTYIRLTIFFELLQVAHYFVIFNIFLEVLMMNNT